MTQYLLKEKKSIYTIERNGKTLKWINVLRLWYQSNYEFYQFMEDVLLLKGDDFFWECRPINTREEIFEFAIIPTDKFKKKKADKTPFLGYMDKESSNSCFTIDNLPRDAKLVIPTDGREKLDCLNLGHFLKTALLYQKLHLFSLLAEKINDEVQNHDKIWVSTSGLGVSWLHVRVSQEPKYYTIKSFLQ